MTEIIHVLYVEDRLDLLQAGRDYLENSGDFQVTTIGSATDAVSLLSSHSFDAILSDYQMPGMNGIELLKHIRASGDSIPFILFTGKGDEEIAIEALNNGADFYLQKGDNPETQFATLLLRLLPLVKRCQVEKMFQKNLDLQRVLMSIATRFVNISLDSLDSGIDDLLGAIGPFTGADRVYLFQFSYPARTMSNTHEWCREGITPQISNVQNIPIDLFPWGSETLIQKKNINIPDITLLPPEAKNEREILESLGIQALFILPIFIRNHLAGFVGLDNVKGSGDWNEDDIQLLTLASVIIANALDKQRGEEELEHIKQNFESFFNTIDEFLFVLDEEGRILYTNNTVIRRLGYSMEELTGQSVLLVHPPERREEAGCTVQEMLAGRIAFCPVPIMKKDGGLIPVETRVTRGIWDGKSVLFGVSKDISQLKLSEEKFSTAFHASAALMAISSESDGRYIDVNETFLKVTGSSREDVIGKTSLELSMYVEPDIRKTALSQFHEFGNVRNFETRIRLKDDSIRTGLFSIDRIIIGITPCLLTTFNDITVLKQAELAIIENEKKFISIFEESPAPILILNQQLRIIEINRGFETVFGYTDEKVIGKSLTEIGISSIGGNFETILDKSGSDAIGYREEMTLITRTGNTLIAEVSISRITIQAEPCLLVQIHDIDEIRRTQEAALRETNAYLENLIATANVPIIVWDPTFIITRANYAFEILTGRSAKEIVGTSIEFLFPPDQTERSMRLFRTTLDGVRWETAEIDIMHRDQSVRTVLWNSATVYTSDGLIPVATIAQGRDITQERKLEQEKNTALVQIQQNLAQLAILNDEIRNPLMIIATYADMIVNPAVTDKIILQTQRIDDMVNQLDKRWMESEKVLNAIRKHYLIQSNSTPDDVHLEVDTNKPGTRIERYVSSFRKNEIFIEEIQAQLYTILDSIDALIYVADMDTYDLLFINRYGRAIFGDIVGQKCYKNFQNNQDGPCSFCTNHLIKDQSGSTGVYRWDYQNHQNGKWFDCRDRAIRWSDGRLVRLEIAFDITEQKQMEKNLRARTEELDNQNRLISTLLDTVQIGIFMVESPSGRPIIANRAAKRLLGKGILPDATEENLAEVYDAYQVGTYEKYPTQEMPIVRGMRGENSHIDDMMVVRPDGTTVYLEVFGNPILDNQDRIVASLVNFFEITDRKRMEHELWCTHTRLESSMEAGNIAWWEMDCITGGVIFNERKARMLGYSAEQFSHYTDFTRLVHPDDYEPIMQAMRDHLSGIKNEYDVNYRIRNRNGEYMWFHDIGRISDFTSDGRPSKIIGLVIEISDRKQVEGSLHEANQKLRLLTGLTRHDILNQISVVQLLLDMALETASPVKIQKYLSQAREVGDQIEATIGFTREYENFGIESSGWQRLYPIFESAKTEVSPGDVTVLNQIPESLEVYADPIIRKVFATLMENAIRHGKNINNIRFFSSEIENSMILTCEDDGVGVPDTEKELIFDQGYGKNTGIGLFLVREILSITGLTIRECGGPGEGARFEIQVPAGKYQHQGNES